MTPMKRYRLIAGYDQVIVAIGARVSVSWLREVEKHPELLSRNVAEKVAGVLNCSADDLMPAVPASKE